MDKGMSYASVEEAVPESMNRSVCAVVLQGALSLTLQPCRILSIANEPT